MRNGALIRPLASPSCRDQGARGRARIQTLYTIAAATLAAIVPLIVFAGFWMRSELNKNQHETEAFLTAQARALSYRIDGEIHQQLSALTALAALSSADTPQVQDFTEDVDRIMTVMPTWTAIALIDPESGQRVVARGSIWRPDSQRDVLDKVRQTRRPAVETPLGPAGERENVFLYAPVLRDDVVRSVVAAAVQVPELREIAAPRSSTLR